MKHAQVHFLTAQTMNTNFTSNPISLVENSSYAIQANCTTGGTLGGTFKLQASVDYKVDQAGNVINAGNWIDVTSPASVTISGAGSTRFDQFQVTYPWVRLVYTKSGSDSGTCDAWAFTRGFE